MTDAPYEPEVGDLVRTDFESRTGREQSGRRHAVVVSFRALWEACRFLIVCPVTSRIQPVVFTGERLPPSLFADLREKIVVLIGCREN